MTTIPGGEGGEIVDLRERTTNPEMKATLDHLADKAERYSQMTMVPDGMAAGMSGQYKMDGAFFVTLAVEEDGGLMLGLVSETPLGCDETEMHGRYRVASRQWALPPFNAPMRELATKVYDDGLQILAGYTLMDDGKDRSFFATVFPDTYLENVDLIRGAMSHIPDMDQVPDDGVVTLFTTAMVDGLIETLAGN